MGVEPSVEEEASLKAASPRQAPLVAYRTLLDVPKELVAYLAGLL